MVSYAMHLLRTTAATTVRINPDGKHRKKFDFTSWLGRRGFAMTTSIGSTAYGGTYVDGQGRNIIVNPKSGLGDVVAQARNLTISTAGQSDGSLYNRG